jgi:hypothetical protein
MTSGGGLAGLTWLRANGRRGRIHRGGLIRR